MQSDGKKIIKIALLSIFFLFIVIYALFRSSDLLFGVKIKNVNITDGAKTTESIVHITGNARHAQNLTLNGRAISIDKEGDFDDTIALLLGYNIITIDAKDKFGNTDYKEYRLIYEKPESTNTIPSPTVDETEYQNELEPAPKTDEETNTGNEEASIDNGIEIENPAITN